jgi:hypothetical protein
MSNEPPKLPPRVYPMPEAEVNNDRRFTLGLILDVAQVLVQHGYPKIDGLDYVDLNMALYRFLYKERA